MSACQVDYIQLGAGRAHHGLGPWAWHERGGDVALGWVTWLVHGDKGWVQMGSSCRDLFLLIQAGRLAGGQGEDAGLGHVTWNFFSYHILPI